MKFSLIISAIGISMALLGNVNGCPTGDTDDTAFHYTIEDLDAAMPMKKADEVCKNLKVRTACITNEKTLQLLNDALDKYKITTRDEAVSLLAYMMYESQNFTQGIKKEVAGQGTYNMQHFNYNYQYMKDTDKDLFHKTYKAYPIDDPDKLQSNQYSNIPLTKEETDNMNAYVYMLLFNNLQYGSAFWYLTTIAPTCRPELVGATSDGFKDFIMNGVKVAEWDETRGKYWDFVNEVVHKLIRYLHLIFLTNVIIYSWAFKPHISF